MKPMTTIFGYPAALVLQDDRGEFEIANALHLDHMNNARLNIPRILEALDARELEQSPRAQRKVY